MPGGHSPKGSPQKLNTEKKKSTKNKLLYKMRFL